MPSQLGDRALDPELEDSRVGLVLAGGGARGAYEAGALSVLLPELEAAGERVSVLVGTSVGALNGAWLVCNLHRPAPQVAESLTELWRSMRWEDVLAPVWSPRSLGPFRALRAAHDRWGRSGGIGPRLLAPGRDRRPASGR